MTNYAVSALAFVLAEQAYVLGMQAENMQRAAVGASMAYNENDFAAAAGRLQALAIEIRNAP